MAAAYGAGGRVASGVAADAAPDGVEAGAVPGETGRAKRVGKVRAVGGSQPDPVTGKPLLVRRQWTEARRAAFLEHLARTCSITHSLKMVAMTNSGLVHLRQRDADFRDRFDQALQMGYQQVEADLLAHALGTGGTLEDGEDGPVAVPAFDPDLALKLLQLRDRNGQDRRRSGGAAVKHATEREIEDELVAKLKGLAKRLALES